MRQHRRLPPRHSPEWTTEYIKSREWAFRACMLMIGALLLAAAARLLFGRFFIPGMVLSGALFIAVLYSAGRFFWHVQKAAAIARRERAQPISNVMLRLILERPVPLSLGVVALLTILIVLIAEILTRAGFHLSHTGP